MVIVTQRKKWTKKAQKMYPGRQLRWMFGQLRDFGPNGNDRPQDVPAIPMVLRKDGKTVSEYELSTQRAALRRAGSSPYGRSATARGSSGNGQKKFIPLKQIPEMSSAEIAFLRDDCRFLRAIMCPKKESSWSGRKRVLSISGVAVLAAVGIGMIRTFRQVMSGRIQRMRSGVKFFPDRIDLFRKYFQYYNFRTYAFAQNKFLKAIFPHFG